MPRPPGCCGRRRWRLPRNETELNDARWRPALCRHRRPPPGVALDPARMCPSQGDGGSVAASGRGRRSPVMWAQRGRVAGGGPLLPRRCERRPAGGWARFSWPRFGATAGESCSSTGGRRGKGGKGPDAFGPVRERRVLKREPGGSFLCRGAHRSTERKTSGGLEQLPGHGATAGRPPLKRPVADIIWTRGSRGLMTGPMEVLGE